MAPLRDSSARSEDGGRLSSALTELAGLLLDTDSFQTVMQELAESSTRMVPNVLTAGITVANGDRVVTVATADALGRLLDERQYDLDEGPCLEAMRTRNIVDVPDMSLETRWNGYPPQVRAHGVEATYSLPLVVRDESIGVLNLYADHTHAFDEQSVKDAATQLVTLITVAVTGTLRNYGDVTLTDQLQRALSTRSIIDQAVGILIGSHHCTAGEAFAILRGASQTRNVRLNQIAQDLVDRNIGDHRADLSR
jgi:GAF domain-containing protein